MNLRFLSFLILINIKGFISCSQADLFSMAAVVHNADNIQQQDTSSGSKIIPEDKVLIVRAADLVIQVGAFRHESYAISLKERLAYLLNFNVVIIHADGFFKVRISGFNSFNEIDKLIPTLTFLGIKNLWIFRGMNIEPAISKAVVKVDTSLAALKTKLDSLSQKNDDKLIPQQIINLQVGVFHRRGKASRAKRRITNKLNLNVEIVREWEYYIVFITGFKAREEIFQYYPRLAALGYPDSFMIDNNNGVIDKEKKSAK